jgi:hypothetical protein
VPDELAEATLLAEVGELRRATQASAESWWYPMVSFGLVAVGGGVATMASGTIQIGWWTAGLTSAALLTARFYRRRSASLGMVPRYRRYWLLWLAVTLGAFAVPAVAPAVAKPAAAWIVISLGYGVVAAMGRSTRLAVLAGMLAAASAVQLAVSATSATTDVACGCILIVGGLVARKAGGGP